MEGLIVSICTVLLAAICHACLQIGISALILLYHESLGKHVKKKTRSLASSYIFGSFLLNCLILASVCYLISVATNGTLSTQNLLVVVGILLVVALIMFLFYYKSGKTTELWLQRKFTKYITKRANATESNIEAFGLGMMAVFSEIPFSLILIVIAANAVLSMPEVWQIVSVVAYPLIVIIPEMVLRITLRRGKTVVDAQKWRIKNKSFNRIMAAILFTTLAIFIIGFKIIGQKGL